MATSVHGGRGHGLRDMVLTAKVGAEAMAATEPTAMLGAAACGVRAKPLPTAMEPGARATEPTARVHGARAPLQLLLRPTRGPMAPTLDKQ